MVLRLIILGQHYEGPKNKLKLLNLTCFLGGNMVLHNATKVTYQLLQTLYPTYIFIYFKLCLEVLIMTKRNTIQNEGQTSQWSKTGKKRYNKNIKMKMI